jgi:hypothetical protein
MKKIKPINTRLPEDVIYRWHLFATENKLTKEKALAELIDRGVSYNPRLAPKKK